MPMAEADTNLENIDKPESLENSTELALSGSIQILSLLGATVAGASSILYTAIGAGSTVLLGTWQLEQQRKFQVQIRERLASIDKDKIDHEYFESSEFKELLLRICNESLLTASSQKHKVLSQVLVNSILNPTSKLSNKLIFVRIVSQLSDEELLILEVMQNAWESCIPILDIDSFNELLPDLQESQTREACDGLVQQRVFEIINSNYWSLTLLGRKLIGCLSNKEEQENFESKQKMYISQLREELDKKTKNLINDAIRNIKPISPLKAVKL